MRKRGILLVLVLYSSFLFAQTPGRYQQEIFATWTETNDILFSSAVPQPKNALDFYSLLTGYPLNVKEWDTEPVDLKMDIFQPEGDTLEARPLIIICFGGGFLAGSRDHWSIRLLCQDLAKRGFVTAAIDYRLGMNVYDQDLAARAVYRGVQDSRSAVRFFKADQAGPNNYKIDTNHIYIGGHSAGAFIGLHNIYMDKEIERPAPTFTWMQNGNIVPDQLPLDAVGNNLEYSGQARATFSLAGALGYLSLMEIGDISKPVLFHSEDDDTVPFNSGEPFSSIIWLVVGNDLPTVYGSNLIVKRADTIQLANKFYAYTDRGHGVHENGSSSLYPDIIPGISGWFYEEYLKITNLNLEGEDQVCKDDLTQIYHVEGIEAGYTQWQVTGGSFLYNNPDSNTVVVLWDTSQTMHKLTAIPYSNIGAPSDTVDIDVSLLTSGQNVWAATEGVWTDTTKWSKGHIPNPCETAIFPDQVQSTIIEVPDTYAGRIRSLSIGALVKLNVLDGAVLLLKE